MESINVRKKIDIFMTLFVVYFFILCLSNKVLNIDNSFESYLMLELIMLVAIISYYTSVTLSLVITLALDFIYMSYKLYFNIKNGVNIDSITYYWIILLPITALLSSLVSRYIVNLQEENELLHNENSKLVMIDEDTNIRNERALLIELPIYMKISLRHKVPVTLFIVRIKFAEKLRSIIGKDEYKLLIIQASEVLEKSLRAEDIKYILDYKTFAFLTITDGDGAKIVKERFKENINNYDFSKETYYKNVKLDIQIGSHTFDESVKGPLDFIKLAERELEYDIRE